MICVQIGDVVEGVVSTLQPYGAFINLGGESSGLLHISQISHDRISSVDQVLEVGQKIKVLYCHTRGPWGSGLCF